MIRAEKLDFWIEHGYNVLMVGKHGVGKTSIVQAAFERHFGDHWRYFSASTLDPWVDLVGVPKERIDKDGVSYLDLVRPREFAYDQIEAMFFDEFNRAHKKVRNAVMELLQFRSINGKKFENLKIIWAAINPKDEGDYDVDELDPAQDDRFQIKAYLPYKPDDSYFKTKYGKNGSSAISWWSELPDAEKDKVSPRRLDYALDIYSKDGDLRDVLPASPNINKLVAVLRHGPVGDMLAQFQERFNEEAIRSKQSKNPLLEQIKNEARTFLANENNYAAAVDWIKKHVSRQNFFYPLLTKERLSSLAVADNKILDIIINKAVDEPIFLEVIQDFTAAKQNKTLVAKIDKKLKENRELQGKLLESMPSSLLAGKFSANLGLRPEKSSHIKKGFPQFYDDWIKKFKDKLRVFGVTTQNRRAMFDELRNNMPPTLTVGNALEVLDVLTDMAHRSRRGTFEKLPNVMGIVNHCIDQISKGSNRSWPEIDNDFFKKRFFHLGTTISDNPQLSEKMLTPAKPNGNAGIITSPQVTNSDPEEDDGLSSSKKKAMKVKAKLAVASAYAKKRQGVTY